MQHTAEFTPARPVDLSARAMLATLSVTQWSGRKLDKRVSADVAAQHGAQGDAGRYNKVLVARDALAEIATIVGAARADHARLTLPWGQDGTRIMPAAIFARYSDTMRQHREAFEKATAAFVDGYPDFVADARARLGTMFDESDYPDAARIAARFTWSVKFLPMPDVEDFRVDMAADTVAALKADMETHLRSAMQDAMQDAWDRLHKAVTAMAEKLAGYRPKTDTERAQGVFRDSLVENLRDLVSILPALNIAGDATLAALCEAAQDKLTTHDAQTLRDDDGARAETQAAAAEIAESIGDAMAAFMGG